jgi:hypothetical protein
MARALALAVLSWLLLAPARAEGRYLDPGNVFSLIPARGWTGSNDTTRLAPGVLLMLVAPDRAAVYQVLVADSHGQSQDAIASQIEASARAARGTILARARVEVAGTPAVSLAFQAADGKIHRSTVVVYGSRAFLLVVTAKSKGDFRRHFQAVNQMTASFRPEVPPEMLRRALDRREEMRQERIREDYRRELRRQERLREERLREERLRGR